MNKYIIVHNGTELQNALDNTQYPLIILEYGKYELSKGLITISQNGKTIIGNYDTIFTKKLIVSNNCTLYGMIFSDIPEDTNIYIDKGAEVYIKNIEIHGSNLIHNCGITLSQNSKSKLNIEYSTISNVDTAIKINSDCFLGKVKNNTFLNINIGLSFLEPGAVVEDEKNIVNNYFNINLGGEAIGFSTGLNLGKTNNINLMINAIQFSRSLCLNNHEALIKGHGVFNDISTHIYHIKNYDELIDVLLSCNNGNIILLEKGKYYGNIKIDKEIAIIGEDKENTILIPKESYILNNSQYGLIVQCNNILISNLCIDGKGNDNIDNSIDNFRDGIRFDYGTFNNNEFKNIYIKNTLRRGFSIWSDSTKNTNITDCIIENIKNQQGIYFNGSGNIKNCIFKNMNSAIQINSGTLKDSLNISDINVINCNKDIIVNCESDAKNNIKICTNT